MRWDDEMTGVACGSGGAMGAPEDRSAVARVLGGESAAFEGIMRRYNQRLYRAARAIVGEDSEAEDVLQEAYLLAIQHLGEFAWRSSLATWLTRIVVNEACGRRRRRRAAEACRIRAGRERAMGVEGADVGVRRREASMALREHIEALPASLRAVLVLRAVEGLDTAETGACLGLSEAAVKVRLHRARNVLRERMESELTREMRAVYSFDGERCERIVRAVLARTGEGR